MANGILTAKGVAALREGAWATEPSPRGAGALQVRKLKGGSLAYYFRYTAPDGRRPRIPIGLDVPLGQARKRAEELSARYQGGDLDLKAALEADERELARLAEEKAKADLAAKHKASATLGALLTAYVAHLKRYGKPSAKATEGTLHRHVRDPWPGLWIQPAQDTSTADLVQVLARIIAAGKRREAAKLRSYLIAAFNEAIRAEHDPSISDELRELHVTVNPARDLAPVRGATNAGQRALSVSELQALWRRVKGLATPTGAMLRFYLLTGGQRVEQLERATLGSVDAEERTFTLSDSKGRRQTPRKHVLPLIDDAWLAMLAMDQRLGPFVFTCTYGRTGVTYSLMRTKVAAIAQSMLAAGELPGGLFTPGDLRRTIETRLAALGVNSDVRAQLQSHGLGGVQTRHYDRHDYLHEKRQALEALRALMEGKPVKQRAQASLRMP